MTRRTALFASVTFIALVGLATAQTMPKPAARESGITAYLQFGGTANSDGQFYALNPSVGYDFNSHFGMAVGAPVISSGRLHLPAAPLRLDWAIRSSGFMCDTRMRS
jgi:hypothetical protein